MDILKFITAGSVDDGKSTLIGRLLYDSEAILADQLEALHASNRKNDDGSIDLAILTDGLKAEREQGITIDVAYKYFETNKRKFIIADAPGHIQYTRNMVTGASNAGFSHYIDRCPQRRCRTNHASLLLGFVITNTTGSSSSK
jgi:sulfate adenylyltransferase subunit 1